MNNAQLFVKTIGEIKRRLLLNDEYEILMIAGLLRKLLMDNDPLLNQINRTYRKKIVFTVNDRGVLSKPPIPDFWSIQDGLDPETSLPNLQNIKNYNKDCFLNTPVMLVKGEVIKIRDVIKHVAHVEGAIHLGMPKPGKEEALKNLGEELFIGNMSAVIRPFKAIARVTVRAMQPLIDELIQ